ncbi:MAG: cation-translocating P-type ATPase [Acidobacteriota bacterium]|nr:cation-translocating P-type ATPase [Acidobacteriota bacterium]
MSTATTAPQAHAIGCSHCDDEAPAPTGARIRGWVTAIAAALVLVACALGFFAVFPAWVNALFVVAALTGSIFPAQRAIQSLGRGSLDINALMVIAVAGAMAIGEFEEAAMVVSLFAAAQWLEAQSLDRARKAIGRLLDSAPADVLIRDQTGERRVAIDAVPIGALMIVRPGDKFALDGLVESGRSDVNQAPITGESLPVEKAEGDEVFAGTVNGHGALTVAVTRRRADTTLARIVRLVETAQAQRAPVQQFIDRFAAWYTPAVVVLAVLLAALPVLLAGQPFDVWLYRALVLLVVACPCALVISTPVSVVSALAGAASHGVLVKGGVHLERLAGVRVVAFDKTGTLTTGTFSLDRVIPLAGTPPDDLIRYAAAVESQSEHPIAAAIVAHAVAAGWALEPPSQVRALPGLGVEGTVAGSAIVCGTPRLFAERGWMTPALEETAAAVAAAGLSPVLVSRDGLAIGVLGLRDRPKADAPRIVDELSRHEGIRVAMITGDHHEPARALARDLNIATVLSQQLPQDKVTAVQSLRRETGAIAMIGDGVNDAPALAAADVGIAMAAMGSAVAIEAADIALMSDDLSKLRYAIRLSRATLVNIRVNVALSVALKAIFLALAVAGVATLWMAVLADTGASALVVANAVRLRRFK